MDTTIGFNPPLPCAVVHGQTPCANLATVGTLYPTGNGCYILQPICRDCVQTMQRVYGVPEAARRPDEE